MAAERRDNEYREVPNGKGDYCDKRTCPLVFTIENEGNPRAHSDPGFIETLSDSDKNHLFKKHVYIYAEYLEGKVREKEAQIRQLLREKEELKKKLQPAKIVATPVALNNVVCAADPIHHVEGFCDALTCVGGAVFKCTEPASYHSNTCGLHHGWKNMIGKAAASEDVIIKTGDDVVEKNGSEKNGSEKNGSEKNGSEVKNTTGNYANAAKKTKTKS